MRQRHRGRFGMGTLRIAVTGGIACGKSTVARMLERCGGEVLDTDDVTHSLEAPGGAAVPEIVRAFGTGVLAADGSIDRRRLGGMVFGDDDAIGRLNAILHPLIAHEVDVWLAKGTGAPFKAVLVPLLYEAGFDSRMKWDKIMAVVCSENEQIRRLKGRGLNEDEARKRIASQMPCAEKAARADCVIWNDADMRTLEGEVDKVLKSLLA